MFWFLIIGIIAGWFASKIIEDGVLGLMGDLVVGVVGSFSGGYMFRCFGINIDGISGEAIIATIGAILLLLILRLFNQVPIKCNFKENI